MLGINFHFKKATYRIIQHEYKIFEPKPLIFNLESTANDVHFQAYLLEGLVRWNKAASVLAATTTTYDNRLIPAINSLSEEVLGKPFDSNYIVSNKYTGIYASRQPNAF